MASVNKVILIGNLGKDPEIRTTPQGTTLARFSLATTTAWKDASGAKQERTEWHRIVAWGKLADVCGQYLKKGRQVYVEGRITTRQYEAKDGSGTRYQTEIVALQMRLLGNHANGTTLRWYAHWLPSDSARYVDFLDTVSERNRHQIGTTDEFVELEEEKTLVSEPTHR